MWSYFAFWHLQSCTRGVPFANAEARASVRGGRGAALGGAVLRKSLGFSHRRTCNHLQPPSVHGVRVHRVRFVKLVARYKTVKVRSENSNPNSQ